MGMTAIVKFYEDTECIVSVQHHFDGYLDGVGLQLVNFLENISIINGIGPDQNILYKYANGIDCLAAQYIKGKKSKVGNIYIVSAKCACSFEYQVRYYDFAFNIVCIINGVKRFEGNINAFKEYIKSFQNEAVGMLPHDEEE